MKECGVSCDKEALTAFFNALGDKGASACMDAGRAKFIAMPCGGGGGGAVAASTGAEKAPDAEPEKEKEEEEAVDMGGLFGDDDEY